MAIIPLNRKRDKVLNDFAKEYREKTLSYLHNAFSLSKEDCEDVFQESSIILFNAAVGGKLDNIKASLFTYFIGICNNKAHEQVRMNGKTFSCSIDDFSSDDAEGKYSFVLDRADKILAMTEQDEREEQERNGIVEDLVRKLPSPCNELLWSFYRDALSLKAIAQMFNYASEGAAKVTKHRCQEKFLKCYKDRLTKI